MIIQPYAPDTMIRLYQGVGWDRSYQDVRWFETAEDRDNYLHDRLKQVWYKCSVVNGNTIKLEGQQMDFISCDYMTFLNPAQTGKQRTICCWVTSIDYVNINTFSVTYEIDYIGTWMSDMVFEPCLVIREHVNDDTAGLWPEPENLETGEIQLEGVQKFGFNPAMLVTIVNLTGVFEFKNVDNIVTSGDVHGAAINSLGALSDLVNSLKDHPEYFPLMIMGVTDFLTDPSDGTVQSFTTERESFPPTLEFMRQGDTLQSYTAVNNKLKCYPYKFFTVDNYNGQVEQYRYEDFKDLTPLFTIEGTPVPKPVLYMSPRNYKNGLTSPYNQQSVVYDAFPQVAWQSDTYQFNMAQYATQPIASVGSTLPLAVASPKGALIGAAITTASVLKEMYQYHYDQKTLHSQQYHAGSSTGAVNFYRHNVGFRVSRYQLIPAMAKRIDNYFTRYGYTVNTYKMPNIYGRQSVNYVMTADAHVRGDIPVQAKQDMESALNRGISFWHTDPVADGSDLVNPIITAG